MFIFEFGKDKGEDKGKAEDSGAEVDFQDEAELKTVISSMPNKDLVDWATQLGIELKQYDNESVMRMRTAVALKNHFFPSKKESKKESKEGKLSSSRSPYADIPTKELKKLAKDNKVAYREVGSNECIQRMWLIKALKDAGVEA